MAPYAKDVLVDTAWVEEHLHDDSIRIVEVDENPALYAQAHIPGAIGFDWRADLHVLRVWRHRNDLPKANLYRLCRN